MSFNILIPLCVVVSLTVYQPIHAQEPDNDIEQIVESQADLQSEDYDFSEVSEVLSYWKRKPLNLNTATREQLKSLFFLTPQQVSALLAHRTSNGPFLDMLELQGIECMTREAIERMLPYVSIHEVNPLPKASIGELVERGEHDLIIRIGEVLEDQRGFKNVDSLGNGQGYVGSSNHILVRYRYHFQNKLSLGLTMEKDAGEAFFKRYQKYGFDFYSGFLAHQGSTVLQKVVLGDYSLRFGQGLTMWSGLGFGKGSVTTIAKNEIGLRPYSSTNESQFLRGMAGTIEIRKIRVTPFVSYRYLDGSLSSDKSAFSSINESGYHRTGTEIAKRSTITQLIYGSSISVNYKHFEVGSILYRTIFNKPFEAGETEYQKFDFAASALTNAGIFYSYNWRNTYFFGEAAHSISGGSAYLSGLIASLSKRVSFSTAYRNYDKNYHCFFNSALSESSTAINERGLYMGLIITPNSKTEFSVYADVFSFPWLRYRVDAPSRGSETFVQLVYSPNKRLKFLVRYKSENKEENCDTEDVLFASTEPRQKHNYRAELSYKISSSFLLRNRVEGVSYAKGERKTEYGYLLYQDVIFNPLRSKFSANARFALFDTDSFDSRVYAYERDVLYSYSFPGFQNRGTRFYVNGRINIKKGLDISIRYAKARYTNVDQVGSGLDLIEGSRKSDIKAQLRMQL